MFHYSSAGLVIKGIKYLFARMVKYTIQFGFWCVYYYYSIPLEKIPMTIDSIIKNSSLCTHAPLLGNLAFPDYTAIYFICFLPTGQTILFDYDNKEKYDLLSITFYDTASQTIMYHDPTVDASHYTTKTYCCATVRIYSPDSTKVREGIVSKLHLDFDRITENTKTVTTIYKRLIALKGFGTIYTFEPYFRFSKQPINLFYPNSRARYLVLPLVTKKNVVVIRSVLPDCGYSYPITYLGFMACNMKTTETDDCVGYDSLEKEYSIFVAESYQDAIPCGYDSHDKSHKCLLWNKSNENPMLVYREVRMDNEALFSLHNNAKEQDIRMQMGDYYPKVTIFYM